MNISSSSRLFIPTESLQSSLFPRKGTESITCLIRRSSVSLGAKHEKPLLGKGRKEDRSPFLGQVAWATKRRACRNTSRNASTTTSSCTLQGFGRPKKQQRLGASFFFIQTRSLSQRFCGRNISLWIRPLGAPDNMPNPVPKPLSHQRSCILQLDRWSSLHAMYKVHELCSQQLGRLKEEKALVLAHCEGK